MPSTANLPRTTSFAPLARPTTSTSIFVWLGSTVVTDHALQRGRLRPRLEHLVVVAAAGAEAALVQLDAQRERRAARHREHLERVAGTRWRCAAGRPRRRAGSRPGGTASPPGPAAAPLNWSRCDATCTGRGRPRSRRARRTRSCATRPTWRTGGARRRPGRWTAPSRRRPSRTGAFDAYRSGLNPSSPRSAARRTGRGASSAAARRAAAAGSWTAASGARTSAAVPAACTRPEHVEAALERRHRQAVAVATLGGALVLNRPALELRRVRALGLDVVLGRLEDLDLGARLRRRRRRALVPGGAAEVGHREWRRRPRRVTGISTRAAPRRVDRASQIAPRRATAWASLAKPAPAPPPPRRRAASGRPPSWASWRARRPRATTWSRGATA